MSIAERGLGRLLILMGTVGIGIAFFLAPWVAVDMGGTNIVKNKGLDLGLYGVPILAGMALVAFLLGLNYRWRRVASIGAAIAGMLGIVYLIMNLDFRKVLGGLVDVHPEIAFWVVLAGFGAILLGGMIEFVADQSS